LAAGAAAAVVALVVGDDLQVAVRKAVVRKAVVRKVAARKVAVQRGNVVKVHAAQVIVPAAIVPAMIVQTVIAHAVIVRLATGPVVMHRAVRLHGVTDRMRIVLIVTNHTVTNYMGINHTGINLAGINRIMPIVRAVNAVPKRARRPVRAVLQTNRVVNVHLGINHAAISRVVIDHKVIDPARIVHIRNVRVRIVRLVDALLAQKRQRVKVHDFRNSRIARSINQQDAAPLVRYRVGILLFDLIPKSQK
jgi:hypothetical protein